MKPKILIILVIIFSILTIAVLASDAEAAQVCCEVTKNGNLCQYTDEVNCALGSLSAATTCEQTSFCQLGCGVSTDEGLCFENTQKAFAVSQNLTWVEDATCDIPQCQKGCCVLNDQYTFVTQARCKKETSIFPDLKLDFREDIKTEQACLEESLAEETGCCEIDQNTCNFGTRAECLELGKDASKFKKDTLCSNEKLSCECTSRHTQGCLPGKEDVYWFDSCGNPEDVVDNSQPYTGFVKDPQCQAFPNDPNCGNCDYSRGTVCGQKDDNNFACLSVNCATTITDPNTPGTGIPRKNGESWCVFDDNKGPGLDTVGSRYFRHSCILGKEVIEECADFRSEFCIQGEKLTSSGRFTEAKCKVNNPASCYAIEKQEDCQSELLDCQWLIDKCVPFVSPGFRFWEGGGTDVCAQASETKGFVFKGEEKEKVAGEEISKWISQKSAQCRALGDCGENINFLGVQGSAGFENSLGKETLEEAEGFFDRLTKNALLKFGAPLVGGILVSSVFSEGKSSLLFGPEKLIGKGIFWGDEDFWGREIKELPKDAEGKAIDISQEGAVAEAKNGELWVNKEGDLYKLSKENAGTYIKKEEQIQIPFRPGEGKILPKVDEISEDDLGKSVGILRDEGKYAAGEGFTFGKAVSLALTGYLLYVLIDAAFFGDPAKEQTTVTVTCSPWQAPTGGNNCEACDDNPNKLCTEYRCRSLGQLCELVNEGTGNETCVNISPKDANSPVLEPNLNALQKGHTLTKTTFPGGFEGFKINQIIEPFSPVSFGVLTDEPSQCKISTKQGIPYKEMEVFFGDNLFVIDHRLALNLPLDAATNELAVSNDGFYTLYAKCQDKGGNVNAKDYFIQFQIKAGPDLTSAVIEVASLPPNAQIPHDVTSTPYSVFLNEPAECRYNLADKDYDQMANDFACSATISPVFYGLYECNTNLKGLNPEQNNIIYVRCRDQPGKPITDRNTNSESYVQVLRPSDPLKIASLSPSGQIFQDSAVLQIETADGAEQDGTAQCGFSRTQSNFILFSQTNSSKHTQNLVNLPKAKYTYYIQCRDLADNIVAEKIEFEVTVDTKAPEIVNIYQDKTTATSLFHIETDEPSTCEYSTVGRFNVGDGKLMTGTDVKGHDAVLDSDTFYIRCKDTANNQMPLITIYL